jgi:hypothetical protein
MKQSIQFSEQRLLQAVVDLRSRLDEVQKLRAAIQSAEASKQDRANPKVIKIAAKRLGFTIFDCWPSCRNRRSSSTFLGQSWGEYADYLFVQFEQIVNCHTFPFALHHVLTIMTLNHLSAHCYSGCQLSNGQAAQIA